MIKNVLKIFLKCVKKKERGRHLPGYWQYKSLESIDDDEK